MHGLEHPLHIQLWSYNYDPEPTGIGPVSGAWARAMKRRGHAVEVVAAHPHYPVEIGPRRLRPYREVLDGISVLRLPLWAGRGSTGARLRQELTFTASQSLAAVTLSTPDLMVVVSPSFPALVPAIANAWLRRCPWILWLQDILPEGAASTQVVESKLLLTLAHWLERKAYSSAAHIVAISDTFVQALQAKGVPREKLTRIYNPATRVPTGPRPEAARQGPPRVLAMGNIGRSQALPPLIRSFQDSAAVERTGAQLVIAGDGVAAAEVRSAIRCTRVEMIGLVSDDRIVQELRSARLGIVSQRPDLAEFNVPSRLMNLMMFGIPVIAVVRENSEVRRIVDRAGGGWCVPAERPEAFGAAVAQALSDPAELERRGRAAAEFAREHFSIERTAAGFEEVLTRVLAERISTVSTPPARRSSR
jgi:putative colanic acid biosynthesis glycosyltransferase WcaI